MTKVNPADSVRFKVFGYDLNILLRRCVFIVDTEVFCALLSFVLEAVRPQPEGPQCRRDEGHTYCCVLGLSKT
jgi:hypothetical protein